MSTHRCKGRSCWQPSQRLRDRFEVNDETPRTWSQERDKGKMHWSYAYQSVCRGWIKPCLKQALSHFEFCKPINSLYYLSSLAMQITVLKMCIPAGKVPGLAHRGHSGDPCLLNRKKLVHRGTEQTHGVSISFTSLRAVTPAFSGCCEN